MQMLECDSANVNADGMHMREMNQLLKHTISIKCQCVAFESNAIVIRYFFYTLHICKRVCYFIYEVIIITTHRRLYPLRSISSVTF